MPSYETLLDDASRLPVNQRLQLIEALWQTLSEEPLPPLNAAWIEEIQRRSAEYDAGQAQTVSWETVRAEALRRIGRSDDLATD